MKISERTRISEFDAFFDIDGILRVGGRLRNFEGSEDLRHPILLGDDRLTILIIKELHENKLCHLRTDIVLANLRQEFWVLRARQMVKKVLKACFACKKLSARPINADEAPLPRPRVEVGDVFKNVGVDLMGPFDVTIETKIRKVWICLFTCSVPLGIHLELVENLSAEAFLGALKRFIATRGRPERFVSENGTNFVRAEKALTCLWESARKDSTRDYLCSQRCTWSFNIPRAAWWGGQFERLIRIIKDCLTKTVKGNKLPVFGFLSVIKEIEAVVNSRPLTVLPDSPFSSEALTPGHFMTGLSSLTLPSGLIKASERDDQLCKMWRVREKLLNHFRVQWRNEYLLLLGSAHKKKELSMPSAKRRGHCSHPRG